MYAAHQCVTALAVGADYLAPYLGRMDEAGKDVRPPLAAVRQWGALLPL